MRGEARKAHVIALLEICHATLDQQQVGLPAGGDGAKAAVGGGRTVEAGNAARIVSAAADHDVEVIISERNSAESQ